MGQWKLQVSFAVQIGFRIKISYEVLEISLPFIEICIGLLKGACGINMFGIGNQKRTAEAEAEPEAKSVVSYSVTYTIECPQCRVAGHVTVVDGKVQKSICNNCDHELKLLPDMAGQEQELNHE